MRAYAASFLAIALGALRAEASSPPPSSEPRVDYRIDATLDELTHFIRGSLEIRIEPSGERALTEVWVHAYLNAFASERTLFLRARGGRSGRFLGRPGRLVVPHLEDTRFPGVDLWASAECDDPEDRTDLRLRLAAPSPPGSPLVLRGEFVAELPEIVERAGFAEDFHLVAQWFPKVAKLEPNGDFVHFPYHPYAEFFANYGNYEVTLHVPRAFVVGSTGALTLLGESQGKRSYRANAENVHDFAWTAWPGYAEADSVVDGVALRLLGAPEEVSPTSELARVAVDALREFSAKYGRYPYSTLTIASPPKFAARAHGMEYPTFLTTGATGNYERLGVRMTPILVSHELAHQWFYGIVGTNEYEFPLLDEGLTSYAEWRFLEGRFPNSGAFALGRFRVSRVAAGRLATFPLPESDRMGERAPDFSSFSALSRYVYGLTPLLLSTLERIYGPERLDATLRAYVDAHWFRHPDNKDLEEVVEKGLGPEARELFSTVRDHRGGYRRTLLASHDAAKGILSVVIRQNVALPLPVELEVEFADGRRVRRTLPAGALSGELPVDARPRAVTLDPDRKVLIDDSFVDNRVRFGPRLPPPRTTLRTLRLLEAVLRLAP